MEVCLQVPRHAVPFELDEDDFLTARPVFKILEVDPPAWALGAIQKRNGHRHPKREVTQGAYLPSNPAHMAHGPIVSVFPKTPTSDAEAIKQRAIEKARRKAQFRKTQQQISQRSLVPQGNLINDDYRFWKGFVTSTAGANEGTCRWCQELFRGREAMLAHHTKSSCKQHLSALYRYAKLTTRSQRYCFACKAQTPHTHWGIPLCDRTG